MAEEASSFWTEIRRYEDILAADPLSYCFVPLSELYRKLGLLDDAIAVAKKGCHAHPDFLGGFLALGAACYDKGLNGQARLALERALILGPGDLHAQKLLGEVYAEEGEVFLAKKVLGQILRQNPDDLESGLLLRSLSAAAPQEPDEELLEDTEFIEELTEVIEELTEEVEEPPAAVDPAPRVVSGVDALPGVAAQSGAPARAASHATPSPQSPSVPSVPSLPSVQEEFEDLEDLEEFWEDEPVDEAVAKPSVAPATPATPATPAVERQERVRSPLTTATMAELYASQGFLDKAQAVYRDLLQFEPTNSTYRERAAALKVLAQRSAEVPTEVPLDMTAEVPPPASPAWVELPPSAQEAASAPREELEAGLTSWLDNIRRRKDGA